MSQISHWFDLSQVYNSKKDNFDFLSRHKTTSSKVLAGIARDNDKIRMPRCPRDGAPINVRRVSRNCPGGTSQAASTTCGQNIVPNGCLACSVPNGQRRPLPGQSTPVPTAPPSRAPNTREGCFIGGKLQNNFLDEWMNYKKVKLTYLKTYNCPLPRFQL